MYLGRRKEPKVHFMSFYGKKRGECQNRVTMELLCHEKEQFFQKSIISMINIKKLVSLL